MTKKSSNPVATRQVREAWREMPFHKLKKILLEKLGNDGEVRSCDSKSGHVKVIGKARTIELYTTTGTVNCSPQGKMKSCNYKNMMPERAIERVVSLAKHGY
jgi:hypothetical protein